MSSGYEIARAVERCIKNNHPEDVAWGYSPRQLKGWMDLMDRREMGERAEFISSVAAAQSSDPKALKKLIKELAENGR